MLLLMKDHSIKKLTKISKLKKYQKDIKYVLINITYNNISSYLLMDPYKVITKIKEFNMSMELTYYASQDLEVEWMEIYYDIEYSETDVEKFYSNIYSLYRIDLYNQISNQDYCEYGSLVLPNKINFNLKSDKLNLSFSYDDINDKIDQFNDPENEYNGEAYDILSNTMDKLFNNLRKLSMEFLDKELINNKSKAIILDKDNNEWSMTNKINKLSPYQFMLVRSDYLGNLIEINYMQLSLLHQIKSISMYVIYFEKNELAEYDDNIKLDNIQKKSLYDLRYIYEVIENATVTYIDYSEHSSSISEYLEYFINMDMFDMLSTDIAINNWAFNPNNVMGIFHYEVELTNGSNIDLYCNDINIMNLDSFLIMVFGIDKEGKGWKKYINDEIGAD